MGAANPTNLTNSHAKHTTKVLCNQQKSVNVTNVTGYVIILGELSNSLMTFEIFQLDGQNTLNALLVDNDKSQEIELI